VVRAAVICDSEGDHLDHYFRTALCRGIGSFAISDASGKTVAAAKKSAGGRSVAVFDDPVRMMREFRPHLTVISTEPRYMPEAISAAVRGGAHVVVEKPACTQLGDFEAAARAGKNADRQVMLAMAWRLHPTVEQIRQLAGKGWLGRGYGVNMHLVADQTRLRNPVYHRSWKASRERGGGGKLIFHGIHYLDLIHHITGDLIAEVSGFCRNVGRQPIEVEDAAVVSMVFRGGMVGTLNTGYYLDSGYSNLIVLWAADGWFRFDPRAETQLLWHSTAVNAPKGLQHFREAATPDLYDRMLQAAADFCRGLRPPFMTTDESVAALRVVFAAYRAAETGVAQKIHHVPL
jgi:predicted dehydrogenase